jgi:hypothetical protein
MANLHKEFLQFYENLQIAPEKREAIEKAADDIKCAIKKYIKEKKLNYIVSFKRQGSSEMGTRIRTKNDDCDLDLGCYIYTAGANTTGHELQELVLEAVTNLSDIRPIHKKKCVSVPYPGGFHIDIPVYKVYKLIDEEPKEFRLAVSDSEEEESDPQGMTEWFKERTKNNQALLRLICYLKAWCSYNNKVKMPPGLAITILATKYQNIVPFRDDLSLLKTLQKISEALTKDEGDPHDRNFKCIVPVKPYDDIFKDYSNKRKWQIREALRQYIANAKEACNARYEHESNELWKKLLDANYPQFSSSMCPIHSDEANDLLLRMDTEKADFLKKRCSSTLLNYVLPLKNIKNIKGDCIDLGHDFTLESELMENVAKVIYVWMKAGGYILCNGKKIRLKGFSTFFSDSSYQHIIEQWEQSKEQGQIPYYIYD